MAERDRVGVGFSATALMAGLLTGTLLRPAAAPPPARAAAPSQASRVEPRESTSASSLAQLRPVMQLLGQALGVPVDPRSQINGANAALADLDDESKTPLPPDLNGFLKRVRVTPPCENASATLPPEWDLYAGLSKSGARAARANADAAPKPLDLKAAMAGLEGCADLAALDRLARGATATGTEVKFLVATIPDYVDSSSGWRADQVIDAIQSAMANSKFVLDRFKLIDWTASEKSAADLPGGGLLHEKQPGALIFRASNGTALRVVLLVLETPTGGLHRESLRNAIGFIAAWNARRHEQSDLRIVGPGFSGGVQSLAQELGTLENERNIWFSSISVVSTATADGNATVMKSHAPNAIYSSTMRPSLQSLAALRKILGELNPGWKCGERVALLTEGNTTFGASIQPRADRSVSTCTDKDFWQPQFAYRFPLHIAQLMSDAQPTAAQAVSLLPSSTVPLNMRDAAPPADQLPALKPQLTSPIVENQINGILDNIQHEGITAVGIVATDERDVLFLARLLRRQAPNVQLFFTASNLLYLHTDYLPFVRGALVASTYPLYLPAQSRPRWTLDDKWPSSTRRELFQSMVAEGVFNATQLQLDAGGTLVDYCGPSAPPSGVCTPPVWISIVGDDGFWPVRAYDFDSSVMAPVAAGRSPLRPHPLPVPGPARVLFALVVAFVYVHALLVAYAWWSGRTPAALRRLQQNPVLRVLAPPITYPNAAWRHGFALALGLASLASVAAWWFGVVFAHAALQFGVSRTTAAVAALLPVVPVAALAVMAACRRPRPFVLGLLPLKGRGDCADRLPGPEASTKKISWAPLGTMLLGLVLSLVAFGCFVWWNVLSPGIDASRIEFDLDRFLSTSMVSPGPAILCIFGAIYVATFGGLRRLSLLGAGYAALASKSGTFRLLAGAPAEAPSSPGDETGILGRVSDELPLVSLLDMPAQNVIWPYSLGLLALLFLLYCVIPLPSTIDGKWFSLFLTCASALVLGSAFLALAQALEIWRRLRPGLTALSHSRIEPALEKVASVVRWNLSLVSPHLSDLSPLATLADRLYSRLLALAAARTKIPRRGSAPTEMDYARVLQDFLKTSGLGFLRQDDLVPAAGVTRPLLNTLHREMREQEYAPLLQSKTWFQLWAISDQLVTLLHRVHWSRFEPLRVVRGKRTVQTTRRTVPVSAVAVAGPAGAAGLAFAMPPDIATGSAPPPDDTPSADEIEERRHSLGLWFKDCETLVALQCALVLRDILSRVMSSLFTAMACLTLLTAAHLFYLFQGRSSFLAVDLAAVAAASAVSIWLLVAMERNGVLSRLRHTTPGTVDINWEFLKRVGIYGVLPLVAVLGSLFPEIQQPIFGWLDPLRKLVNF